MVLRGVADGKTEMMGNEANESLAERDEHEPAILEADILSGAPANLHHRSVRIYQNTKAATQSGTDSINHWRIDWDVQERDHSWENPLMGWSSSADFMQATHIKFKSKEDAIHFAEKQGWPYMVAKERVFRFIPKQYASNYTLNPRKVAHCK